MPRTPEEVRIIIRVEQQSPIEFLEGRLNEEGMTLGRTIDPRTGLRQIFKKGLVFKREIGRYIPSDSGMATAESPEHLTALRMVFGEYDAAFSRTTQVHSPGLWKQVGSAGVFGYGNRLQTILAGY